VRPRFHDLKIVAAVGEVRPAADDRDVLDGEVMVAAKVRAEMSIVNAAHVFVVADLFLVPRMLIVPFFLALAQIAATIANRFMWDLI